MTLKAEEKGRKSHVQRKEETDNNKHRGNNLRNNSRSKVLALGYVIHAFCEYDDTLTQYDECQETKSFIKVRMSETDG